MLENVSGCSLVTHKNCMDGSTCAILYKALGGIDVHFTNPGNDQSDKIVRDLLIEKNKSVLIADISISVNLADELINKNRFSSFSFEIYDHHKTAIPLLDFNYSNIHIDKENSCCGCRMLFEAFKKLNSEQLSKYKNLVMLVDDHDRWIKNYPEADELATLHSVIGQKFFIERFLKNADPTLTKEEQFLVDLEHSKMKDLIEDKKKQVQSNIKTKTINGKNYKFGFVVGPGKFASEVGNAICEDPYLDIDVAVLVGVEGVSLRSSKACDLDLSEFAKQFGGGGHKAASGVGLYNILGMPLIDLVAEKLLK